MWNQHSCETLATLVTAVRLVGNICAGNLESIHYGLREVWLFYAPNGHTRSNMSYEMISPAVSLLTESTLVENPGRCAWHPG